ncbi:unnamed protein product [Nippostrongylus brasiliensis]|uniref:Type VI secretion system tube protein Hcp n=1 Tax=Nippostrongylus brasiliensis TaxID=27835 RepID=A0A0N4XVY0_NIPBR|nr:unnamed protein product [Nippostrongylus brasiliensis]
MSYTLFDEKNIARIYTDNMTQYVLVYAESNEKADYICAENITEQKYRRYYIRCSLLFVLKVDINDCQVVNSTTTTIGKEDDMKGLLEKLKLGNLDDNTPVTITYINSSTAAYNLYYIGEEVETQARLSFQISFSRTALEHTFLGAYPKENTAPTSTGAIVFSKNDDVG